VAPPDFPVFLGRDWFGDWRAQRIRELLGATQKHSIENFAAMQVDDISVFARQVLPKLTAVQAGDARGREAVALLARWQGEMATDRPQPLIFNAWMRRVRAALLEQSGAADSGATPPGMELVSEALLGPEGSGACGGDCNALLTRTLSETLADLAGHFGPDPREWRWGRAHHAVFAHPLLDHIRVLRRLAERRIASPGDDTTLFRGGMRSQSFASVHGASYRGVYDLAAPDRSLFVITPGQSGNVLSRLAWNFVRRWRDGGTITLGPDPASVVAHIRLEPEDEAPRG
jgi:penicillin amidase